jgi:hypothetical protein
MNTVAFALYNQPGDGAYWYVIRFVSQLVAQAPFLVLETGMLLETVLALHGEGGGTNLHPQRLAQIYSTCIRRTLARLLQKFEISLTQDMADGQNRKVMKLS